MNTVTRVHFTRNMTVRAAKVNGSQLLLIGNPTLILISREKCRRHCQRRTRTRTRTGADLPGHGVVVWSGSAALRAIERAGRSELIMHENPDLRQWRTARNLTQAELAKLLPVNLRTLQNWERPADERKPPPYLWRALEHLESELASLKILPKGNRERTKKNKE